MKGRNISHNVGEAVLEQLDSANTVSGTQVIVLVTRRYCFAVIVDVCWVV
jgi:hypothetical protein